MSGQMDRPQNKGGSDQWILIESISVDVLPPITDYYDLFTLKFELTPRIVPK